MAMCSSARALGRHDSDGAVRVVQHRVPDRAGTLQPGVPGVPADDHHVGVGGQAGAVRMGLARAISLFNPELRSALRKNGFLTRDSRMKERKKYGQKGARKRFQFTKR